MDDGVEFLVLGAGPTGLGAARQLAKNNCDSWAIVEAAAHVGGLASSFVDGQGFTWDVGGHVQFSHYDYFDQAMIDFLGADQWHSHIREAWVWMRDRFIPYPLQNNIHRLPPEDIYRCLEGLVQITRSPLPKPENFGQWINACSGEGLAEVFMRPYNYKVWAYPPEQMNAKWVGERVSVTDLSTVLKSLVFNEDVLSWGPNRTFGFPKSGGTGSIWNACADELDQDKIHLNTTISAIDLDKKVAVSADGRRFSYGKLISTMPLDKLIECTGQTQFTDLSARGLLHSSSHIIGIGLRGRVPDGLRTKCWMYFPEDDCPFYRCTVFSNYAENNVPDGGDYWSLMCEVSQSPQKPVNVDRVVEDVIAGLLNTQLIRDTDTIVSKWKYSVEHGYPTPGIHRDEALAEIIPYFDSHDVYSRGRFGLWRYEVSNQDHSFMQGVEVVERLLNGRAEITAFDPERANGVKHPWPFDGWGSPADMRETSR